MRDFGTSTLDREPAVDPQQADLFVVVDTAREGGPGFVYGPFDSHEAAEEAQESLMLQHNRDEEAGESFRDPEAVHVHPLISPSSI